MLVYLVLFPNLSQLDTHFNTVFLNLAQTCSYLIRGTGRIHGLPLLALIQDVVG